MFSSPCKASCDEHDASEHDPCLCTGYAGLEVFGEAPVASEPGEGALHHPAPRFGPEGPDAVRAGDDFNGPRAEVSERIEQFVAAINPIGEHVPQCREVRADSSQERDRAVIVLHVGRMNMHAQQ